MSPRRIAEVFSTTSRCRYKEYWNPKYFKSITLSENYGLRRFLLDYSFMYVTFFPPTQQLVGNKGDLHSHLYEMQWVHCRSIITMTLIKAWRLWPVTEFLPLMNLQNKAPWNTDLKFRNTWIIFCGFSLLSSFPSIYSLNLQSHYHNIIYILN